MQISFCVDYSTYSPIFGVTGTGSNKFDRGNPFGAIRPLAPRIARHGVRSVSDLTRPLSPPSGQLIPSAR